MRDLKNDDQFDYISKLINNYDNDIFSQISLFKYLSDQREILRDKISLDIDDMIKDDDKILSSGSKEILIRFKNNHIR